MCRRSAPVPVVCTRQFSCDLGPRGRARGLRNCLSVMAPVHPPQVFWDTAPSFGSRRQNARIGVLRLGVSNHVGPSKLNRWKKLSKGRRLAPRGRAARVQGRLSALRAMRAADSMPLSAAALASFSARILAAPLPHDRGTTSRRRGGRINARVRVEKVVPAQPSLP